MLSSPGFRIQKYLPILIVFCFCLKLHELGDIVEEGEDYEDDDV